jgi:hypothetical protein
MQRLIQRRRWTAPANRWAARRRLAPRRRGNALKQRLRLAFADPPPQGHNGQHRRRCALPVPLLPTTPQPPPGGTADRVPLLEVSGCAAPVTGPLRPFLPACKRLECTAAGLLRQGLAARRAPAERPLRSDRS